MVSHCLQSPTQCWFQWGLHSCAENDPCVHKGWLLCVCACVCERDRKCASGCPVSSQLRAWRYSTVTGKVIAKAEAQSIPVAPYSAAQSSVNDPTASFPDEFLKETTLRCQGPHREGIKHDVWSQAV